MLAPSIQSELFYTDSKNFSALMLWMAGRFTPSPSPEALGLCMCVSVRVRASRRPQPWLHSLGVFLRHF